MVSCTSKSGLWSLVLHGTEEAIVLYQQLKWSMVSCTTWDKRDHGIVLVVKVVYGLLYYMEQKRPWYCTVSLNGLWSVVRHWDRRVHGIVLGIKVVYGLLDYTGQKTPWYCTSSKSSLWSFVLNGTEETTVLHQPLKGHMVFCTTRTEETICCRNLSLPLVIQITNQLCTDERLLLEMYIQHT